MARRRRTFAIGGLLVVVVIAVLVYAMGSSGGNKASTPPATSSLHGGTTAPGSGQGASGLHHGEAATGIPAIESGVLPWQLASPLSREVVVPGAATASVTVLGGLTTGNATTGSVVNLAVPAGTQTPAGALANPTHDAAVAILGGRALVFGGGVLSSFSTVQAYPLTAAGASATGVVVGQLPQPRSDADAVTIGRTAYVVGGYDGTVADPQVLSTTNGSTFHVVGSLPVPVRYPAVAALGQMIYAFGGQQIGGAAGPVNAIQRIDTASGKIEVVGHLPQALLGASAVTLGGVVYVAGGTTGASDSGVIYAFDPVKARVLVAGHLVTPLSNAAFATVAGTAWLVGGESGTTPTATVQMMKPNPKFGTAGAVGAGSPYFGGKLLIADRGNDRILLVDSQNQVAWSYPSVYASPPPGGFYFPDDAFFTKNGTQIISNQEENQTVVMIGFPSGQLLWSYGHPRSAGSTPGYLNTPDDAYLLKNGQITVADANNCRVLVLNQNGTVASQIGTTGSCVHNPPTSLGSPNGDTPLADGNFLISEINGSWVSEYTPQGHLVWTVKLPVGYPSDPQQLGPDLYLLSDYSHPGGFIEFTREGQVTYRYQPPAGQGEMFKPSLTELLPSGVFMTNDDYRDRMVAVDPTTQALVWQYGVTDTPGTGPGFLNTPDGFDLLMANGVLPLHPVAG
jgi:hypothetical protein